MLTLPGFLLLTLWFASGCQLSKQSAYFKTLQKDTTIRGFITNDFESKIQPGDQLAIVATSLSAAEDEIFNKAAASTGSPTMGGFTVDVNGFVLLHRLGQVKVAGLTRKELAVKLQTDLQAYMKDVIVNVNYVNHKVTVFGAVGSPQVIPMPEEQMSLIDVLVKSGDIAPNGLKEKVMVIRENGTEKEIKMLNLEDHSILTSPWYYVQPNDIVYVRQDYDKIIKQERRQNLQMNLALITTGISFILIVVDRIIR